jgi:hypothetical protein
VIVFRNNTHAKSLECSLFLVLVLAFSVLDDQFRDANDHNCPREVYRQVEANEEPSDKGGDECSVSKDSKQHMEEILAVPAPTGALVTTGALFNLCSAF